MNTVYIKYNGRVFAKVEVDKTTAAVGSMFQNFENVSVTSESKQVPRGKAPPEVMEKVEELRGE